ncbi:hypothetical protein OZ379_002548, partial [Salmonella enterica]|nr:hypothetical protein [Salmonella enterica subsp. diarizonae]EDS6695890.1 hypothetical protein [Salmonella enterica subsp. diarizonae serovar 61:l,[v],[z13]:1,5,[7]]EDZ6572240.1 hypothetical protein [Salmonella enterica]EFU9621176.1 hypothetical protein [Salmonella enterica subsp. enterica serovar Dublin]EGY9633667.1 hypothetical protein [Salmonella enterica subsp. enterica serovar Rough O:c:z]EHA2243620.1 hypothetical protein [Salmonella enterica subsp. diarizonae serovar 61:k:1,5,(7)]EHK5
LRAVAVAWNYLDALSKFHFTLLILLKMVLDKLFNIICVCEQSDKNNEA